jgi:hypothetical protein
VREGESASVPDKEGDMTILWIIIAVIALAALIWVFSRRRGRA